jgi:hypothetical protein
MSHRAGQAFADTLMEDVDEEELQKDSDVDDLGQVLQDAHMDCEDYKEKTK